MASEMDMAFEGDRGGNGTYFGDHTLTIEELRAKGIAPIKKEYLKSYRQTIAQAAAFSDTSAPKAANADKDAQQNAEVQAERKKRRGMNKNRPVIKQDPASRICFKLAVGKECAYGSKCRFSHDVLGYLAQKPPDLGPRCVHFDKYGRCPYGIVCRFGSSHIANGVSVEDKDKQAAVQAAEDAEANGLAKSLQKLLRKRKLEFPRATEFLARWNEGNQGAKAQRTGGQVEEAVGSTAVGESAMTIKAEASTSSAGAGGPAVEGLKMEGGDGRAVAGGVIKTDPEEAARALAGEGSGEQSAEGLNVKMEGGAPLAHGDGRAVAGDVVKTDPEEATRELAGEGSGEQSAEGLNVKVEEGSDDDEPLDGGGSRNGAKTSSSPRERNRKEFSFQGKLYLAPLTTVGNMPFRTICKQYGADITCGEMAMAANLLQAQASEWALLRRHKSEDIFGVQVCGGHPDLMSKCAELLEEHCPDIDFVDLNCGCPLDIVFKKGAGSGLPERPHRLEGVVRGMASILTCPLTVKLRTGVDERHPVAHKLIPQIAQWGAAAITLHGRTRQQRYTKLADWTYIKSCAELSTVPLIGNGDVLSYTDYYAHVGPQSKLATVMIGRGALVKPWLFTEIKEQRHWDISASERLDMLRQFVDLGIEHWGSDDRGINNTRRFLLEWLSFLYRYIPVGLLDVLPQRMNERPPQYYGRSDLETLMASDDSRDWLKITEMLLGPAPSDFYFVPKHKSNSYDTNG